MAGISQTIPSYYGGISQQADELKNPGQVKDITNGIPDVTWGLYKRPGSKRVVSPDSYGKLANVQAGGTWFHYYRDESEGSYIGQIAGDGTPRIWKADGDNAGDEQTIAYGSTLSANSTNLKAYLATANSEDLQPITINDTTLINNRSKEVLLTADTTTSKPHTHAAYIEILRTENGRQYALNLYDSDTTTSFKKATRVKISATTLSTDWGTGNCRGIGTQVFGSVETTAGRDSGVSSSAKNLTFRIEVLGQVGDRASDDDGDSDQNSYRCSYSKAVDLLHGGYGWETDDTTEVTMDSADGGKTGNINHSPTYTVKVTDHETVEVKGTINSGVNGICRPAPTPWDAQTAVSIDTILGGIQAELSGTGLSYKVIGNGIYLHGSNAFNVEICHPDLMRVMQDDINDVSKLPTQCKNGYIVKVSNSEQSDEDDYYMKFVGQNDKDGPGSWVECAKPGIRNRIDAGTMPVKISRSSLANIGTDNEMATFTVDRISWNDRLVGDDTTNAKPEFISKKTAYGDAADESKYINKILYFRNRLCFLSGEWVITSRPGDLYNFWNDTALTVGNKDPINISSSSTIPSPLYDGIEAAAGLLVFTTNAQYLLSSDDAILNPDTAKLRRVATFNYNKDIPPLSLGTTIGFVDNSNKYSRFYETVGIRREQEAVLIDQTKVVPTLLEKDIDLITNSRENGLVLFGKTDSEIVHGYKYITIGDKRIQSAWFKWKFNNPIKYHFIIDDTYYYLDTDNFLCSLNLMQSDSDPSITEEGTNFLIHLDNWTTIQGGLYDASTKLTTFTNGTVGCVSDWTNQVTTPNGDLVVVDTNTDASRVGRYAKCTLTSGSTFTVPGDWSWTKQLSTVTSNVDISNELLEGGSNYVHNMVLGEPVLYLEGDTAIGGLVDGTVYYGMPYNTTRFRLATTKANAEANTYINLTSTGSGTHTFKYGMPVLHIGYLYDYQVDFPRLYTTKTVGQRTVSDANASLILHRLKFSFGKTGLYETTLNRIGKLNYTDVHESTTLNTYNVSDAPYVDEVLKTIPVYEKNKNVDITLKSAHPAPATLRALSWEGDYSPLNYRRG